ncbi:apoptosis facilitator Bcl-2-like protein 14 isoform X2 [Carcharodon carcharias]|uniref:apoptosis facilitator Bcl-2-like protein 14 isoform X2 n=1 Tax=Carcharodon carcharias TaxID=13397 RepID=UPI001B7E951B|nr:apoptosis facilitator Bcl-2-like protein 14 isoform X2 [Carcharodon carcharias]
MGPSDAVEDNSMLDSNSTDDDSFEFRMLMAYAKRTLPIDKAPKASNGKPDKPSVEGSNVGAAHNVGSNQQAKVELRQTSKIQSGGKERNCARKSSGRRKSIWRRIPCLRGESEKCKASFVEQQGMDEEGKMMFKSSYKITFPEAEYESMPSANEVAEMLQKIMNAKQQKNTVGVIRSYSLEVDATGDDQKTIDWIIALLTTEGDSIDEEIKKDPTFTRLLGEKPSLTIFKKVMDSVLEVALPAEINSEVESETERKLKKIAFVVHATTRFAAVGNHPMTQIMGFGTKYLQDNYTAWVTQKGGQS